MQTPTEALAWASIPANFPAVEKLCDEAAANLLGVPPLTLAESADREAESRLLSRLECRPGGLDPRTPSRTREWLWRGLWTLIVAPPAPEGAAERASVAEVAEGAVAESDEDLLDPAEQPADVLEEDSSLEEDLAK